MFLSDILWDGRRMLVTDGLGKQGHEHTSSTHVPRAVIARLQVLSTLLALGEKKNTTMPVFSHTCTCALIRSQQCHATIFIQGNNALLPFGAVARDLKAFRKSCVDGRPYAATVPVLHPHVDIRQVCKENNSSLQRSLSSENA